MRWFLGLLVCTLAVPTSLHAQPQTDTTDVSAVVETALEAVGEPADASAELVAWLTELAARPLAINRVSTAALSRLPGLSVLLARRIVHHRETEGLYASLDELRGIQGMDESTYRAVRPFLTIDPAAAENTKTDGPLAAFTQNLEGRFIQRVTRRLDVGKGYRPDTAGTRYVGSPSRLYTRLQLDAGHHLSVNLTLEKDPGEAFRWHPSSSSYGYDHVTAHAAIHDLGRLETLIVGDYGVAFGQGLALWRSFSFSKGRDVIEPVARQGNGIDAFSSTEENRFFPSPGLNIGLVRL